METTRVLVLDTETAGNFASPFIYDIGWVIADIKCDNGQAHYEVLQSRDFVIKQVYNNKMLFASAFYGWKRMFYASLLKGKSAKQAYFGAALNKLKADMVNYGVGVICAFNGNFDRKAIDYNCAWYHKQPLNVNFVDIRKLAIASFYDEMYEEFCHKYGFVTDKAKKPSTTAESFYAYLQDDCDHKEKHMALSDALEELAILTETFTDNRPKCGRALFNQLSGNQEGE